MNVQYSDLYHPDHGVRISHLFVPIGFDEGVVGNAVHSLGLAFPDDVTNLTEFVRKKGIRNFADITTTFGDGR